ncbi:hypothetical protein C0992_012213, partial [Termitomyces sp. T32_za158]
ILSVASSDDNSIAPLANPPSLPATPSRPPNKRKAADGITTPVRARQSPESKRKKVSIVTPDV